MTNIDIRTDAEKARVKLYEIAEKLGVTDSTFSRLLRRELPDEKKQQIREIIKELREGC